MSSDVCICLYLDLFLGFVSDLVSMAAGVLRIGSSKGGMDLFSLAFCTWFTFCSIVRGSAVV